MNDINTLYHVGMAAKRQRIGLLRDMNFFNEYMPAIIRVKYIDAADRMSDVIAEMKWAIDAHGDPDRAQKDQYLKVLSEPDFPL